MANFEHEHEYASRHPKYPSYTNTPNYLMSQALDTFNLQREVSSSEHNGNQSIEYISSSINHNGIAFNRMGRKSEVLRGVYNLLEGENTSNYRNVPEQLENNMTIESSSTIPISSNPRSPEYKNFASKNVEESTARTVNRRIIKHRKSSENLRPKSAYGSESSISERNGSPSPDSIISQKQYKRYPRHYSAHEFDLFEAQAAQENSKNKSSKYENDRSRKEKLLDFNRPLFARSNLAPNLSDKRETCADKLDRNRTVYMSDQDNLCISKPFAYSKVNNTSGHLWKFFENDPPHSSRGMANTIASISAEYEKRSPIESSLRIISRSSGTSTSVSIQPKDIIQRSRYSINPEVGDGIDISFSDLTTSPTLNINIKRSDINETLVTHNVLAPESGNVRESKSMDRDYHKSHSEKTISNSMHRSRVEYQTAKLNTENEKMFDSQDIRQVDRERNKNSGKHRSTSIDDDEISDQANDVQNLTHKKSDMDDEISKSKSNVMTQFYVESRESDSEKKIPQDLAIDYQATNSPQKIHKNLSPKIGYQPTLETKDSNEHPKADKEPSSPEINLVEQKNEFFSTDHNSGKSQETSLARCLSRSSSSRSLEDNMLSRASNEPCPPSKSDINPEEDNDTRDIKQELQSVEEKEKLNSDCLILPSKLSPIKWDNKNQTPESKANTFVIQTPRVIGAYIETPMPYLNSDRNYDKSTEKRVFSLESNKLKWEMISDSKKTPSQAQDLSQVKFPRRDMNIFHSRQIPINTAPRISASEDLRLIKIEQNIEDSVMDSYLQEALNNVDVVTDIDYLISKSKNEKSLHVKNEDSKSESPPTQRELYVDDIMIERIRRKLDSTTDSINDTKRGIERLEKQFSTLSTDNITEFKHKTDTLGTRLLSWFIVRTSSPKPQKPVGGFFFLNRNWKLTWLGFIISIIFVWYLSELAMCEAFCHPECSSTNTWQPSDPFFPWAIPTKFDQWTGNHVSQMIEEIFNWLDPNRNSRTHWPKQPYSGYDWWGGNFAPAPLHVLNPNNGGLGNIDDDNEVNN
ncbi:hypothetical protein Golomagni_03796 [Golovinomyces magnicellulatus]|nr:hypothetical protein Golomagni_03796 [Golovinomyces magnicellulatus]